jgi:mannose-1-phosphate guanylyltransferase
MFYAVIMAGGSGTRMWPYSRQDHPKQALKIFGDRSMFQYAVERIASVFPTERIFVVTRARHAPVLMDQMPELPDENFILEPEGRGTAPAIGLAAIHLQRQDPDASMAILTADHYILNVERFCQVLTAAERCAADGSLVTLGIQPTSASTGFGYIKQGSSLGEKNGFTYYAVQEFTEKPDSAIAQQMVAGGNYSWNSGMFIWQVDRIMEEFERQMPEFNAQLTTVRAALGTPDYQPILEQVWPEVVNQSIDYGIMEGAHQVIVLPVDIGWTDIGSWGSLFELLPPDEYQNVAVGQHIGINTHRSLVLANKRLVATLGVEDLIIVDTDDALLVCSRDYEQDVKAIVDQLKIEHKTNFV